MSELKRSGAVTVGIIGTGLTDRNEKIKEILETPCGPGFIKLLDVRPPVDNLTFKLEDKKDD